MKTEIDEQPTLKPREVQDILRIGPDSFRALVRSGRLRALKVGNSVRITRADFARFLRDGTA